MRRFFANMNPTLRGFGIIALIVLVVLVLRLETTLIAIGMLLRIAFFLAIAFFVYLLWRERRAEIANWSARARTVFYGAALLIVADLALFFWGGAPGRDAFAFVVVLLLCGFAMWRTWRDQHTYL
jgi:small-conductance mechanosensitive channel